MRYRYSRRNRAEHQQRQENEDVHYEEPHGNLYEDL